ncbi:uncharacterized protein LY89DRAFT_671764 [Mollisia scopiformis]|uniref:Uncharacterized protein n=1 Tax=Mollisia scopiformis TaxID=149040 RepID=A0A194X2J6_MOLSC|nr:uncharacterized protein LY89DRAFT_671764 [Mollisia scopiformis]KUJ14415.1 hypothetical protein LY89DRAFT_671764 [Mollisia scopiformis]
MTVLEVINVGCAILSASAEVAPFVQKYMSNKNSKNMEARRASRQATVETDDEDDDERSPASPRSGSSQEERIGPGELKDLMRTLQAQSEAVQAHSQMISHLVQERGLPDSDRLSSIPEESKIQSISFLDDEFQRMALKTSFQDFAFPPLNEAPQIDLSTSMSRTSSTSISNASMPSSPATSVSSVSSFSSPTENRRLSFGCPPSSYPMHSLAQPSSPTASFSSASTSVPSMTRRVSFGSSTSRVSSNPAKRFSAEMSVEKALWAPLPNKYQGSRRSLSRTKTMPLPIPEQQQRSQRQFPEIPSEKALSYPPMNRYPSKSTGSPPPSTLANIPRRSSSSRIDIGPRASSFSQQTRGPSSKTIQPPAPPQRALSFSSQSKHRHASLQTLQPPISLRRPSDIPSKEQWRSSLKSAQNPPSPQPSPQSYSPTPSIASTSSAPTPIPASSLIMYQTPKAPSDSFNLILSPQTLTDLQPHLPTIPHEQITHHASTWSYAQTLDQLLHPDHCHLKGSDTLCRSYLSSSIRSYISTLAFSLAGERENFPLMLFLFRFVMLFGVDVLRGVPSQCGDPTGLREVESSYMLAGEIFEVLEGREGEM